MFNPDISEGVPFKDVKTVYVDEASDKIYVGAHAGGMMVLHRKTGRKEFYNQQNGACRAIIFILLYPMERRSLDSFSGLFVSFLIFAGKRFTVINEDVEGHSIQKRTVCYLGIPVNASG